MLTVKGREVIDGQAEATAIEGAAIIRVEDNERPEFWLEISIPETELLRLLAQVHDKTHGPRPQRAPRKVPFDGTY